MDPLAALVDLVKTAGVPGAIAVLCILRLDKRLDALTKAVLDLPARMSQCLSVPRCSPAASRTETSPR